jgi:hypothetical protein
MATLRYDYHVYYFTPKANPICHFWFADFRPIEDLENGWRRRRMDAYVVKVVDTATGMTVYERAQA